VIPQNTFDELALLSIGSLFYLLGLCGMVALFSILRLSRIERLEAELLAATAERMASTTSPSRATQPLRPVRLEPTPDQAAITIQPDEALTPQQAETQRGFIALAKRSG
jgi:hypothetical protein